MTDSSQTRTRARILVATSAFCRRLVLTGRVLGRSRRTTTSSTTDRPVVARALRDALNDGGVTFIKMGQMLSTRPDVVGPAFAAELSTPQTASTAVDWPTMEQALRTAIGRPLEDVSSQVDPSPLASVAQVHAGELRSGESVVIKIQKPQARDQVTAVCGHRAPVGRRLEPRPPGADPSEW